MKKITALIDGSIYSHSVCDHAAWVADREAAAVEIVHVLGRRHMTSSSQNLSGQIGLGARTALLEELAEHDAQRAKLAQKRGRVILDDAKARVAEKGTGEITTLLRHGGVVETVHDIEHATDLIVMGKRGEAADFDKGHLGSNLERVVRASHKPVLVAARAFKPISTVMIAFDAGKTAMRAVEYMAASPVFADTACHLITVGEGSTEASRRLEGAAAILKEAGRTVSTELVDGEPEEVIGKKVDAGEADLLVMGAYGHSRIRTMIIGSTTTATIRACKIPLLLFR